MFKVGDKVIFIDKFSGHFPEFYPPVGTIGEVVYAEGDDIPEEARGCWVKWPEGSLKKLGDTDNEFYCSNSKIRLIPSTEELKEEISNGK